MNGLSPAICLPAAGVLLAACVATQGERAAGQAKAGSYGVSVDAAAFSATVAAGAPGVRLTSKGAVAVPGLTVAVARMGGSLGMADGALAKKAARAGCGAAGGRFDETAIGAFDRAGGWRFAGACA